MHSASPKSKPIFGPPRAWRQDDFVASDDRVRGGSSQSYLTPSATLTTARFHGVLDTTTLGGAGFASQRTTTTSTVWNLSEYGGVELHIIKGDGKKYTLNLKTTLPEKMENGRDASTVEYAFDFTAPQDVGGRVFASWHEFQPIFRGRPAKDAEPLDTSRILRWSIMMRSFFEQQSGPFSLTLATIKARHEASAVLSEKTTCKEHVEDGDWDLCNDEAPKAEKAATSITPTSSGTMRFCSIL